MPKVALSYGHGCDTWEVKHSKGVYVNGKAYEEHTFNAAVGVKVRDLLKAHGVDVLELQPPMGKDVPLGTRTSKANAWGADIYWSIHANAASPAAKGLCGFYWKGSTKGLKLAQLYAKYCKAEGFTPYSDDYMYPSEKGTWSDFHELRESHMPALLTENGFMTNAEEFKLIFENKDNYYERLAQVHVKAILEYFGIVFKAPVAPKPAETVTKVGWLKENSVWYYYKDGKKLVGWLQDKPKEWYYLDPKGGAMVTGLQTINGKKYFFLPNGKMAYTSSEGDITNG
jgi:N-acetylmuramoyl-L-alanine amidase